MGFARHALSIDENRERFPYVGWGNAKDVARVDRGERDWLKQVWFAGNHSDIGGSYLEDESRLSDISLGWMIAELKAIDNPPYLNDPMLRLFPDAGAVQHDEVKSSHDNWMPSFLAWKKKPGKINVEASLHPTAFNRFEKQSVAQYDELKPYRPIGLRKHVEVQHFYKS